ncbi:hypothetical protein WJX75_008324 [Coccomyxa subellipsoidea]|uniref:SMP domain-containing protein n=1 Tax=Coccomyxa subellipsoidea TaxID=248742 RepID=A0ABR2YYC2_9CHLO
MQQEDEKRKRKAEDHVAGIARSRSAAKTPKVPASSAAWATAFISEVSSAAQVAIQQTALGDAKGTSRLGGPQEGAITAGSNLQPQEGASG